jgi:hypothetical protein
MVNIMPTLDYIKTRAKADFLIQKFGMNAVLRRMSDAPGVTDRKCVCVMPDFLVKDAPAQLANPTDRTVYIAAGLGDVPSTPPDFEKDQLVTFVQPLGAVEDEVLPFTKPIKPIRPAGIVVAYEVMVKR